MIIARISKFTIAEFGIKLSTHVIIFATTGLLHNRARRHRYPKSILTDIFHLFL